MAGGRVQGQSAGAVQGGHGPAGCGVRVAHGCQSAQVCTRGEEGAWLTARHGHGPAPAHVSHATGSGRATALVHPLVTCMSDDDSRHDAWAGRGFPYRTLNPLR